MRPADTHRCADRRAGITGGQRTACDRNPRKQSGTDAHSRRRHVQVTPGPSAASPRTASGTSTGTRSSRAGIGRGDCRGGRPQLRRGSRQEVDGPPVPTAQRGCANPRPLSAHRDADRLPVPCPPTCASPGAATGRTRDAIGIQIALQESLRRRGAAQRPAIDRSVHASPPLDRPSVEQIVGQDRSGLVLRLTQCYWRSTSATRTLSPLCAANVDLTVPPARDDTERVAATVALPFACHGGCGQVRNGPDQDKARSCGAAQSGSGPSGTILVGLMCGCVV